MNVPTGLIFAMRSRYNGQSGGGPSSMIPTPHSLHSVKVTTLLLVGLLPTLVSVLLDQIGSNPSVLGSSDADQGLYSVGQGMRKDEAEGLGESGNDFNEMAFSIEKVTVTAKSRALKDLSTPWNWTQDLKAIHGLNAEVRTGQHPFQ